MPVFLACADYPATLLRLPFPCVSGTPARLAKPPLSARDRDLTPHIGVEVVELRGVQALLAGWRQRGTSTALSVTDMSELVERVYALRRPEEVSSFLQSNSFLIPLLFEARIHIERHFGWYAPAFLEVVSDPEAPDDRELYALIGTELPPGQALAKLERLDEQWWLDALPRAKGKLCIDLEFL